MHVKATVRLLDASAKPDIQPMSHELGGSSFIHLAAEKKKKRYIRGELQLSVNRAVHYTLVQCTLGDSRAHRPRRVNSLHLG